MNFERLDDTSPVEPDSAMRSAVARRARRLRQRRAIVPGAALLAVAGAAIVVITMLSNESTVPSRVVAGPNTTTSFSSRGVIASVSRDGVDVEAITQSRVVAAGARVPVTLIVSGIGGPADRIFRVRVCIVDPPLGKGWTGFDPGPNCPRHSFVMPKQVTVRHIDLVAPEHPGDYSVLIRWSPAPSGDFLPIPLRVLDDVSAVTSP